MKTDNNSTNIVKFHKKIQLNIGFVIFGIFMLYVIFHVFTYITRENINVYEVTNGTLSNNNVYQALAIRQETVVNAEMEGQLLYYAANLDQVGVKSAVYSIDTSGNISSKMSEKTNELSQLSNTDLAKLQNQIGGYIFDYRDNDFQKVYNFKNDIESSLQLFYRNTVSEEMAATIQAAIDAGTFKYFAAPEPGIVVYQLDGYEGLTLDSFSSESFDTSNLNIQNLKANTTASNGQPVYKLVTSDKWNLVLSVDDATAEALSQDESHYVEIKFVEDGATTWASYEFVEKAGTKYLILSLDDGVARYANNRFIKIELLLNEKSGLKIPNSSIVEKEFYMIPETYLFNGGDNTDSAFMVRNGSNDTLVFPDIYHEENGYLYVDPTDLPKGSVLVKQNSVDTYTVGSETSSLQGVYCVNKGYATFKQIELLYQNSNYSIIKNNTSYGLALYDHIVLNGSEVEENSIIN